MTLRARDARAILHTYSRLDMEIVRGEGMYLHDAGGKAYLDFFGGLAVNALGYGNPAVLEAIETQMRQYLHVSNLFPQQPQIDLAELLIELSGCDRVCFANSGAETMEAAVKLVRKWGSARGRRRLLSFSGAFHGRTMSGLSLMDAERYREGYGPFLAHCETLPFNDVEALRSAVDDSVAAVFFEPIQGEGGVVPVSDAFAEELKSLRDRHGVLLVADEIQTGLGRTGRFLASEHWDLRPDLVTVAKALGGGLPLGALLVDRALVDVFGPGGHGSTFGGNPVACSAGIAVLQALKNGVMDNAHTVGNHLHTSLAALRAEFPSHIEAVRGRGCMAGIVCTAPAAFIRDHCLQQGLLVNVTRERVIRLLPPLILTPRDVENALSMLRNAFNAWPLP